MSWWRHAAYKVRHYEFWPFSVFYFPVYFYYLWLAIKHRSLFFFTASNPSIETGGMLGESKWDIFRLIPKKYIPVTRKFSPDVSADALMEFMQGAGLEFPIILKPDIGERGWMVERISYEEALKLYLDRIRVPFLLQQFIDWPLELGVFYVRLPDEDRGRITSIVRKGFLKVKGDGESTVEVLLQENVRARIQFDFSSPYYVDLLRSVPAPDQEVVIEEIGNHCRGTTFWNDSHRIDLQLEETFDRVMKEIPDFYFGRVDLRTASYADLRQGRNFKILELNGAGSEPGHIYDPAFSLWDAYRDVVKHLNLLSQVSHRNRLRGVKYYSLREGLRKFSEIRGDQKSRNLT